MPLAVQVVQVQLVLLEILAQQVLRVTQEPLVQLAPREIQGLQGHRVTPEALDLREIQVCDTIVLNYEIEDTLQSKESGVDLIFFWGFSNILFSCFAFFLPFSVNLW